MANELSHFGVVSTRPAPPTAAALEPGLHWPLGPSEGSPALFVPSALPAVPVPLVVLLHGATSNPLQVLPILQTEAEERKFLLLAPKSADYTWDAIRTGFGSDIEALNLSLAFAFDHFAIDESRVAIAGFSDGASYALSVGLVNGELFSRIFAFSPGFVVPGPRVGQPLVFISHGRNDQVLPLMRCGRRVAATLQAEAYYVDYWEFEGGHEVPPAAVTVAVDWLYPADPAAQ